MHDDDRDAVATLAALHAARETGVLDAVLSAADGPTEVAAATGVDERTAAVVLDVLADAGFFERLDGAYEPTNRALGLLTTTDLRSIGTTPHAVDRFACYAALPDALDASTDREASAGGDARSRAVAARPEEFERNRLGAVQATDDRVVSAAVSAAVRAVPDPDRVLDLGGAPGPYATEFAARGHDVVLRDDPGALDPARPLLAPRAVELDAGSLTDAFPTADLAFASDLVLRLHEDALDDALAAVHDALTHASGTGEGDAGDRAFVAVEHLRDRSPRASTRRLEAIATGMPGDVRTERALRETATAAGFERVDVHAVPGLERAAVVARPRST